MAISYRGGRGTGTAGTGGGVVALNSGLTGGSGAAALANDLVVVTISVGTAARQPVIAIATPGGYTKLTVQRTTASAIDANVQTAYKIMPATPDTSVTIPNSGNAADGISYRVQVFAGVDTVTPMDVAATYATGSGTNNLPNGAAITPVTAGAWILVCGGGAAGTGTTLFTAAALTNFVSHNGADTNDGTVGAGYYTGWTSGEYDPAVFGGGSTNAANSWGCTTVALRPATTDQTLTQSSRFDNSNTFYTHVLTPGVVALTQSSRFDNSNTFYTHVLTAQDPVQELTQTVRFDNSNGLDYTHVVSTSIALTQSTRFDNSATFYPHTLSTAIALSQSARFDNTNVLNYQHELAAVIALEQSARFDNTQTYYQHDLAAEISLVQSSRFDNVQEYYQHALSAEIALTQSNRFDNDQTYYQHELTLAAGGETLTQVSRFDNTNTFYTHTLTTGEVVLTQSSRFDNLQTYYQHILSSVVALVQSSRFENVNEFYAHTLTPGEVALAQSARFDNEQTYYQHALSSETLLVQSSRFDNDPTYYTHVLTAGPTTLEASRFNNENTFYNHILTRLVNYPDPGDVMGGVVYGNGLYTGTKGTTLWW